MPDMYDSWSSDNLANSEIKIGIDLAQLGGDMSVKQIICTGCKKVDCICDEETMEAMDNEDRDHEEMERDYEDERM